MNLRLPAHAILVVALLSAAACGRSDDKSARNADPSDPVVTPSDEALMNRAIAKARATHSQFVQTLAAKNPDHRGFAVKKAFPIAGRSGGEHMWLSEVKWDGKAFSGIVDNTPVYTKAVALGDRVTVTPEELSDWMYVDRGTLVGGYTLRVLHFQSSPEKQNEFTRNTGIHVPPIDF